MTCKFMSSIHRIVADINRTHQIQLENEYIERIKRLFCGALCDGHCQSRYIEETKGGNEI